MKSQNYDRLTIYITSHGRSDKMRTLNNLPRKVLDCCTVVVSPNERKDYEYVCNRFGVELMAIDGLEYMAEKRQWCIENCPTRYVGIMDDDLSFFVRNKRSPDPDILIDTHLHKPDTNEFLWMFDTIYSDLWNGIPLVGVSGRGGNSFVKEDYQEITRMHRMWFFDKDIYMKLGININPFKEYTMDDMHMVLTFLENGYRNRVYYCFAQDDQGSNSAGGASIYRTNDTQRQSAFWLSEHHPTSVAIKMKVNKTGWNGMDTNSSGQTVRTDVNVSWKTAWKAKERAQKGILGFLRKK